MAAAQGAEQGGAKRGPAETRRLLLIGLTLYLVFVAAVGWSFRDRDLWSDEIVSLMLIGGHDPASVAPGNHTAGDLAAIYDPAPGPSPAEVWRLAAERDNHPPGYTALFAALLTVTGDIGAQGVRFLTIALTGLFIFPALLFMRELGWRPAWLTAAIVALSPFAMYAAREIRPYGLMLVLGMAGAWLTLKAINDERRKWWWLAALLLVNIAGCTQHKLFVGALAGELALLGLLALRGRRFDEIAKIGAYALATLALCALIPNLLKAGNTIGAYETAWLQSPQTPLSYISAFVSYFSYLAAWWAAPPDDLLGSYWGLLFFAAFVGLPVWATLLLIRGVAREKWPGPAILFLVSPVMFFAMFAATGYDFSKASRYSVAWAGVAAAWLVAQLRPGRGHTLFAAYAALSAVAGVVMVLGDISHRNPDRTRDFAQILSGRHAREIVWLLDDTLNNRALLLALEAELSRAGSAPDRFVVVPVDDAEALVPSGSLLASPRRYDSTLRSACAEGSIIRVGNYFACTAG